MFERHEDSVWTLARWERDTSGPVFSARLEDVNQKLSGQPGWQSQGGPGRSHPARAFPGLLEIDLGGAPGALDQVVLIGVLARWASPRLEGPGTIGASIQIGPDEGGFRIALLNGRHYADAFQDQPLDESNGDNTSRLTLGECELDGETCRVDALAIDIPPGVVADRLLFRDLGSPASFTLFDVLVRWRAAAGCPFHSGQGGVTLAELGSVIRLRDRVRFRKAVAQLEEAIQVTEDLDEARGEALTFVAVATAATLELGAPRRMHRLQLEAARRLERADSNEGILEVARECVAEAVGDLFERNTGANDRLIDRALGMVERQFAKPLTDAMVASQLGLSPSHFRFLFRQATGQPFHKYLIAVRLERAKKLLTEQGLAVSDVASAVGFSGLSHFSRAFSQRFNISPTQVRNSGM